MIVSEKSHQNLSEYIQFLFSKLFKFNKIWIISRNFENFMREKLNHLREGGLRKKLNYLLMLRF